MTYLFLQLHELTFFFLNMFLKIMDLSDMQRPFSFSAIPLSPAKEHSSLNYKFMRV